MQDAVRVRKRENHHKVEVGFALMCNRALSKKSEKRLILTHIRWVTLTFGPIMYRGCQQNKTHV